MHLTLRQLQCFSAVAKNLSYTKAAAELHLTQPAVSMQIRQLEQQAGLLLELADLHRYGGLGQVQFVSGPRETEVAGDGRETLQLPQCQMHNCSLFHR